MEVTELQRLRFRFPAEDAVPRVYQHIGLSYLDLNGQPQRVHHIALMPVADPIRGVDGILRRAFTELSNHLVNTPLKVRSAEEALTTVREVLAGFYEALRAGFAERGRSPALAAVSQSVTETAFSLEIVLIRLVSAILGVGGTEGNVGAEGIACVPPTKFVRNDDDELVVQENVGSAAWIYAGKDSKERLKGLSRIFADHPIETLYVVPPVDSVRIGRKRIARGSKTSTEQLSPRRFTRQDHLFASIQDAPIASFINPHEHGGLIASLLRARGTGEEGEPLAFLHPSHTSVFIPEELYDLLPEASKVYYTILYSFEGAASENLPLFDDEEFWQSVLETASVETYTSGDLISHYGGQPPNYYEEERYLGPVGPVGSKARLLQKAALLQGYNTLQYSRGSFALVDNVDRHLLFHSSATPLNSAAAKAVCNDKETTRLILQRNDVPVPQGRTFKNGDVDGALAYADLIGFPVVVKPAMGTMGIGVRSGIRDKEEMRDALHFVAASRLGSQDFIVEQHIFGDEYRILVVGDEVIAAVQRVPASVVGDGRHNIAELILRKNAFRRTNPQLASSPIVYSQDTARTLDRQGMALTSVPEPDLHVQLSSSSNISLGGDSREMSDELHPTVIDAAIRAVKAIPGLNYCGVDFLLPDPTKSIHEQHTGICELNAQAATGTAQYPLYGTSQPVPQRTIEAIERKFKLQPVRQEVTPQISLRLTIRGRIMKVGFHRWFERWAIRFGVVGRIFDLNNKIIRVEMMGDHDAIAALSAAAVGGPRGARPTSVVSEHVPPLTYTDFKYITPWPLRIRRAVVSAIAQILKLVRR